MGVDRDDVAQQNRSDELHRLDRDGRGRPLRDARGDDAAGDVPLAEHPAAEDLAVDVDVGGRRADAQGRAGSLRSDVDAIGAGLRSWSSLRGASIAPHRSEGPRWGNEWVTKLQILGSRGHT